MKRKIYTYGLNEAEKAVVNILFPKTYRRNDCTESFQNLLSDDAICVCMDPEKLTEKQWEMLEARYAGADQTLLIFTSNPDRELPFPYLRSSLTRAISRNRAEAVKLLKRASFPCLLPTDEETGIHHVLNDGFVVLDVETSGIDPRIHEITKVSAVRVVDFQIADQFETLVRIHRPMDPETEKLTGITNEMLEHAPCIREVLAQLTQWYPLDPLVFFFGEFADNFLHPALLKTETPFDPDRPQIDLLYLISRLYLSRFVEHGPTLRGTAEMLLGKTASDYGDDALLTAELLIFLLRKLWDEFGFRNVNDLFKLYTLEYDDVL